MTNIHRVVCNESLPVRQAAAGLAPARGQRGGASGVTLGWVNASCRF